MNEFYHIIALLISLISIYYYVLPIPISKAAFITLLGTLDGKELKAVHEYLKTRNRGGKTDAKLAGVARLLFGADMEKVENTMQECGAVLTSIETAVQYGYECFIEAEETDIGGLKEIIESVMWEKVDKDMKD